MNQKPKFQKISSKNSLIQNDLLNRRVFFDFKTDKMEYRLRLLPMATAKPIDQYLQINFTYKNQPAVAYCECSVITALFDLESTDFDIYKLSAIEQNAAFGVLAKIIEENSSTLPGLIIHKMQLTSIRANEDLPLKLSIKVTSVEHLSYIHLQLSNHYLELIQSVLKQTPLIPATNHPSVITFKQDLEMQGCQLNQQEISSLEPGDVLLFENIGSDYRICLANRYRYSLSVKESGYSLLPMLAEPENRNVGDWFDITIKLHQALVTDIDEDNILRVAQQQIEHSRNQPLKTLYCNQKPFAVAESMHIGNRFGMRLHRFVQ